MKLTVPKIDSVEQFASILSDPKQYETKVREFQNFIKTVKDLLGKLAKKNALDLALKAATDQKDAAAAAVINATKSAEAIIHSANDELLAAKEEGVKARHAESTAKVHERQAAKHLNECQERCANREQKLIDGEKALLGEQKRLKEGRAQLKGEVVAMRERIERVNGEWNK